MAKIKYSIKQEIKNIFNEYSINRIINENLNGGAGDKVKISDVDRQELKVGLKVEMEHTSNSKLALEIVLDHLYENPKYYSTLYNAGLIDEPTAIALAKQYFHPIQEHLITEGVNDPSILKAMFLAGGPGAGKSYSVSQVFGVPEDITRGSTSLGLKIINSDIAFENRLKKAGVNPKNLSKFTNSIFNYYTKGSNSERSKAKEASTKLQIMFEQGRLGLIIDGTGADYDKIATQRKHLEEMGYDTALIFINTNLNIAKKRNSKRSRTLPNDVLEKAWHAVQDNIGKFQNLFSNNFTVIDNSEVGDFNKVHKSKISAILKFINSPIKNPIGKEWIEAEKTIRGIK